MKWILTTVCWTLQKDINFNKIYLNIHHVILAVFFSNYRKEMFKKSYHPLRLTGATPLCLLISITWMKTATRTSRFKTTSRNSLLDVMHVPPSWKIPYSSSCRQQTRLAGASVASHCPHWHQSSSCVSDRSISTRPSAHASPLVVCGGNMAAMVF